jgi:hypothetical protein
MYRNTGADTMAGQHLGAPAPAESPSTLRASAPLHLVPSASARSSASTRTRRHHGAFTLGAHLACVYSTRRAGACYGVSFEVGAGTLALSAGMTAGQARSMARALLAAAAAVDAGAASEGGAA